MSLYDSIPGRPPLQRIWQAKIAKAPTDFGKRLAVTIPGIDPSLRWEGCRWQSHNTIDLPARGDDCLVAIDNNNEVWVVCWWPY